MQPFRQPAVHNSHTLVPAPVSSYSLVPPPAFPTTFAPARQRSYELIAKRLLALAILLVPFILTFIPLHSPVPTESYNTSPSNTCVSKTALFRSYSNCNIGGRCCPIEEGLLGETATRCTVDGMSCYQPVLGNWGLVVCYMGFFVMFCVFVVCCGCCRDVVGSDGLNSGSGGSGGGVVQAAAVIDVHGYAAREGGDGGQYQRMSEVVEMR